MESPTAAPEALFRPDSTIGAVVVAVDAVLAIVEEGEIEPTLVFGVEDTGTATSSVEVELHGGDAEETTGWCC